MFGRPGGISVDKRGDAKDKYRSQNSSWSFRGTEQGSVLPWRCFIPVNQQFILKGFQEEKIFVMWFLIRGADRVPVLAPVRAAVVECCARCPSSAPAPAEVTRGSCQRCTATVHSDSWFFPVPVSARAFQTCQM